MNFDKTSLYKLQRLSNHQQSIKRFTIMEIADNVFDIKGDICLSDFSKSKKITKITIKFNNVYGAFSCANTEIQSLTNCPNIVTRTFDCSDTNIRSLYGSPQEVGGSFMCINTPIKSLEYITKKIGYCCFFQKTNIQSLKYLPKLTKKYNSYLTSTVYQTPIKNKDKGVYSIEVLSLDGVVVSQQCMLLIKDFWEECDGTGLFDKDAKSWVVEHIIWPEIYTHPTLLDDFNNTSDDILKKLIPDDVDLHRMMYMSPEQIIDRQWNKIIDKSHVDNNTPLNTDDI